MAAYKTPGVYIVEKTAFPNSVVEVATAVPAFIGYTEKASNKGTPLSGKPWRISSMAEFVEYFGGPPRPMFKLDPRPEPSKGKKNGGDDGGDPGFMLKVPRGPAATGEQTKPSRKKTEGTTAAATEPGATEPGSSEPGSSGNPGNSGENEKAEHELEDKAHILSPAQVPAMYYLYYCMRMFFQNGGGPCYIVSVGGYEDAVEKDRLAGGLTPLIKEQEPTMVVVPDAMLLANESAYTLQQDVIQHCGYKMKSRVAVLDVPGGYKDRQDPDGDVIKFFREGVGANQLDFAAAYYPWVRTTVSSDRDVSFANVENVGDLQALIRGELNLPKDEKALKEDEKTPADVRAKNDRIRAQLAAVQDLQSPDQEKRTNADKALRIISSNYQKVLSEVLERINLLPPAAAMAGVYTMVDNTRGVWKAPANVGLAGVTAPAVNITHDDQEDLNVTPQGKSINAIRSFIGEGVLVWGARTLDGNSLDWRYVNVRRTMIMLEESIRLAAKAYVFDANDAKTWTTMRAMIRNFLTGIWKRGGLAGATPDEAFSVHVGLGETMTPEDILEGILRITVLVAITRPAEFIEITFQQQMQKS